MRIANSNENDIPEIFRLYRLATNFQKVKFPENQWPEFSEELVLSEIKDNRQFKLLIDENIACVWAITHSDPQIWEEDENNSSIYIHRIATNPNFRGNNFVQRIVDWSIGFAKDRGKTFVRMDTCGKNDRLIEHYTKCGFEFLGIRRLKNTSDLPSHYENADVCFFEMRLD